MPTSSQSKILSVVDYQLVQQQQQANNQNDTGKAAAFNSVSSTAIPETKRRQSRGDYRQSSGKYFDNNDRSPSPATLIVRRPSTGKLAANTPRSPKRTSFQMTTNDIKQESRLSILSGQNNNNSFNINDQSDSRRMRADSPTNAPYENPNNSSLSGDEEGENIDLDEHTHSLLSENARRLLMLGTIRPSRTFYKDLPAADVEHLMEYFRRMRNTNRKMTSEEINQELKTQFTEYKPKIFYDSSCVTKFQVNDLEKIFLPFADKIRSHCAEVVKLDNPMRFVIKSIDNDTLLTTIPREYNDCLLTLVSRTDPLRKSDLICELVEEKFVQDVKTNSLDISYFPGGVNYDVPHEEIDESGVMQLETYEKLKKRLSNKKIWYFNGPPEKKPNAVIAILPKDSPINIDHQRLLDCVYDRLKSVSTEKNLDVRQQILSIEFVPLSCILNSYDILNQFIVDCDTHETKQQLLDKPLKFSLNKQSVTVNLESYDENIQKEYEKSVKAEKYRELIKNHDEAMKQKPSKK